MRRCCAARRVTRAVEWERVHVESFARGGLELTWAVAALAAVAAVAWLAAHLSASSARQALLRLTGDDQELSFASPIVRTPIRVVWAVVFLLVAATLIFPALELAGAELQVGLGLDALIAWLLNSGLRVILVLLLAYSITSIVRSVLHRIEQRIA